jgi:hypothetical protein
MTPRPSSADPGREPDLTDAQSEAVGRHIAELTQRVQAPPSLRAWIAAAETARPAPARRRPRVGARLALAAGGALAAVLAVVLVLAGVGGGGGAPSVDDAAALALARPTAAAPAPTGPAARALGTDVGGVSFPNYTYRWPAWHASGMRHDRLSGRDAATVTYHGPRGDIGYTIVDGKPLPEPDGARRVAAAGVTLRVFAKDGATVVTWRRGGHTCILAGRGPGVEAQLVKFATWA